MAHCVVRPSFLLSDPRLPFGWPTLKGNAAASELFFSPFSFLSATLTAAGICLFILPTTPVHYRVRIVYIIRERDAECPASVIYGYEGERDATYHA